MSYENCEERITRRKNSPEYLEFEKLCKEHPHRVYLMEWDIDVSIECECSDGDWLYIDYDEDKVLLSPEHDSGNNYVVLPGLEAWKNEALHALEVAPNIEQIEFEWVEWNKRGIELARTLRQLLPDDYFLFYSPPFEDYRNWDAPPLLIEKENAMKNKTKLEYPASHSVDTCWFAIDKDGRLALLDSGEEGWLPADTENLTEDDSVIRDAILLNSKPIADGFSRIDLEPELLNFITKGYNFDMPVENYFSRQSEEYWDTSKEECLMEIGVKLNDKVKLTDLEIWKCRIKPEQTLVLQISDSNDYYIVELRTTTSALYMDLANSRILAESYVDTPFYYSYSPKDDFSTTDAYMKLDDWNDYSAPRFAFNLPENFHNIPKYNISFEDNEEFNLEECTGVCATDLESYIDGVDDYSPTDLKNFQSISNNGQLLINALFHEIVRFSSKNVWQLIDKYNVSPMSKNKEGQTAIEVAEKLLEKNKESLMRCYMPGLACLRIRNMLRLKEKQLCSKSNK